MSDQKKNTLRLLMPQWQGGNNHAYYFGAQLLAWLAPETDGPVAEVPVECNENHKLANENGIMGRTEIMAQLRSAEALIAEHQPDSLVVLGGDCLVDLVPFARLAEKYGDQLGILWVDAHPDIMTSEQFEHSHATVLRALMGEGDSDLTSFVSHPVKPSKVMYAGVNNESEYESAMMQEKGMRVCRPDEIRGDIHSVQKWIDEEEIKVLAIHLDLDVLSTSSFGALLFTNPNVPEDAYEGIAQGQLSIEEVLKVIGVASAMTEVVGIGVAEHLPWDAINLKKMLEKLPLIGGSSD